MTKLEIIKQVKLYLQINKQAKNSEIANNLKLNFNSVKNAREIIEFFEKQKTQTPREQNKMLKELGLLYIEKVKKNINNTSKENRK